MRLSLHRVLAAVVLFGVSLGVMSGAANADGAVRTVTLPPGCWEIERTLVGLDDDGAGVMTVPAYSGRLELAILSWAGSDDLTPQRVTGGDRADSELIINGVTVAGVQLPGETGYADFPENEWFVWEADIANLLSPRRDDSQHLGVGCQLGDGRPEPARPHQRRHAQRGDRQLAVC